MVDVHSQKQRSFNMSQIKSGNTTPELILRKKLSSSGIKGYRLNHKIVGKPDITFTKKKVAIFVDGCFWHKCSKCFIKPSTNKVFWQKKLDGNVIRDKKNSQLLKIEGYKVLRFWENEVRKNLNNCYALIMESIKKED